MKKKFILLINVIITVLMLIGCAPPKEESDNKSKVHTQNAKKSDQNIKIKVGDEEDDVKEKDK
ncbi:hypothetical protein [Fredinandcohnia onubensis]|uniref:hypothetical protein n=1 Tax=Fredinandcohnia onubensis TaxID=1571209 RepID=UPI000C0BCDC3|nr:hypothetical protein [Fredinandcohnia onubensis]